MVPLLLAAYGPDWVDLALMIPKTRQGLAPWSHSIPAVVVGACIAALLYKLLTHRSGAMIIAAAWGSHWLADLVTGLKPIVGATPQIGLDVYHIPSLDFVIELLLVSVACLDYGSAFAGTRRARVLVGGLWASLVASQGILDVAIAHLDPSGAWNPSLAHAWRRPHVTGVAGCASPVGHAAWLLHCSRSLTTERVMSSKGPKGVVTLVCLTCGKERFYTQDVPATVSCEQCSGTVFRTFATPTEPDDAAIDALEAQARSIQYGDSSPDTTRDDVRDLDAL
jgi:hypothetical protein